MRASQTPQRHELGKADAGVVPGEHEFDLLATGGGSDDPVRTHSNPACSRGTTLAGGNYKPMKGVRQCQ